MSDTYRLLRVTLIALMLPSLGAIAQEQTDSRIEILTTFDYPTSDGYTNPRGINNRGDVTGDFADFNGTHGFIRLHNGTFSPPINDPNDTIGISQGTDINQHMISGVYANPDFSIHGFFFSHGIFTPFDIDGAISTS